MRPFLIAIGCFIFGCAHVEKNIQLSDSRRGGELYLCGRYYLDYGARIKIVGEGALSVGPDAVLIVNEKRMVKEFSKFKQGENVRVVVRAVDPCKEGHDANVSACLQKGDNADVAYYFVREMHKSEACDPVSFFDIS